MLFAFCFFLHFLLLSFLLNLLYFTFPSFDFDMYFVSLSVCLSVPVNLFYILAPTYLYALSTIFSSSTFLNLFVSVSIFLLNLWLLWFPKPTYWFLCRNQSIVYYCFETWCLALMTEIPLSEFIRFMINSSFRRRTHLVQSFSVVFLYWFYVFS